MSSDRQRQANRRNAKASTGPRTRSGKARAAQNARTHGLTTPSVRHPLWSEPVERLAVRLAGPDADPVRLEMARQAASAHFDIARARHAQNEMMTRFLSARATPPARRPADPVAALSTSLGVDLKGIVASLQPGLPPYAIDRCAAFVEKTAKRISRIRAPRFQPPRPETFLIKAARMSRYQRRALSRGYGALRQLRGPAD